MTFKNKHNWKLGILTLCTGIALFVGGSGLTFADYPCPPNDIDTSHGSTCTNPCTNNDPGVNSSACAPAQSPSASNPQPGGTIDQNLGDCIQKGGDLVKCYVNPGIDLFAALVGVIVVASIIMGGIQYSTSAGDPQKTAQAKSRIVNAIIALIAFGFLFGFLQFIIPGGAFH